MLEELIGGDPKDEKDKKKKKKPVKLKSTLTGQISILGLPRGKGELAIAFYAASKGPKAPKKLRKPWLFEIDELGEIKPGKTGKYPQRDMLLLFKAFSFSKDAVGPKDRWTHHIVLKGNSPHPNEGEMVFTFSENSREKGSNLLKVTSSFVLASSISAKSSFKGKTNWSGSTEGIYDLSKGIYKSITLDYSTTSEYGFSHGDSKRKRVVTERGNVVIKLIN